MILSVKIFLLIRKAFLAFKNDFKLKNFYVRTNIIPLVINKTEIFND